MGINQKKQKAKHPQSCNKSMLPVSWGQDWQLLAPPAFNHQDCPSAPTHGLVGRGQGHGLRSSPRWSSGPWGISYDPGLWDHPPQPPAKPAGAPGERRDSPFSPRAPLSPRAPGETQGMQRTPVSGQQPSTLEATPGSAPRGVWGGREAEPHACSASHTVLYWRNRWATGDLRPGILPWVTAGC